SVPLVVLDVRLQVYFYRMQCMISETCHPLVIHAEAGCVVRSIISCSEPWVARRCISEWAQRLFFSAIARLDYSRTVAVIVHDIMADLFWASWDKNWYFEE
ncbi:hypothetical protein BKA93DRAFT_694189, partial [Sparassis latifolia]